MIVIILIVLFSYILLSNLFPVIREGHTGKCDEGDKECAKIALYEAEQNAPVIEKKMKDTKVFLSKKIDNINEKILNLAKKQKKTSELIANNSTSISKIEEEL